METQAIGKTVEIPLGTDFNGNVKLEKLRIDPTVNVTQPPVYCTINGSPSMTSGNFTMINGKAKSGKTFFLGSIVASFVTSDTQLGVIKGSLPVDKRNILYFDTEQSEYHCVKTVQRICELTGIYNPYNLHAYRLRGLSPAERLDAIEYKIMNTDNLGLVVIDGIRDLLKEGINDEKEATSLTSKLLKWTDEYLCHIILVLHQNKKDNNARGHIGTELVNKAECTLSVEKNSSGVFIVSCEFSRCMPFEKFGFSIEEGMIVPCEIKSKEKTSKDPSCTEDETHHKKLDIIFGNREEYDRKGLLEVMKKVYGTGESASRPFIAYFIEKGWIGRRPKRRGSCYYDNREK